MHSVTNERTGLCALPAGGLETFIFPANYAGPRQQYSISQEVAGDLFGVEDRTVDEWLIMVDPDAHLKIGQPVLVKFDGVGFCGRLETKRPKKAKRFSVTVVSSSGKHRLLRNYFDREEINPIIGLCESRHMV